MTARIPSADVTRPELQNLVATIVRERGQLGELYPHLLHSPGIAKGMIALGNGVRHDASFPPALRELVICRVGIVNGAIYEVSRHRQIAAEIGVPRTKLDALEEWPASDVFTDAERAALAYADVVTTRVTVHDELFAAVAQHWNTVEILELTVTIAYYNMVSRVLTPLNIGTDVLEERS